MTNANKWTMKLALAALAAALAAPALRAQEKPLENEGAGEGKIVESPKEGVDKLDKKEGGDDLWERYLRKKKELAELERQLFCRKFPEKCKQLKPEKPPKKPRSKCPGSKEGQKGQSKCGGQRDAAEAAEGRGLNKARQAAAGALKSARKALGGGGEEGKPAEVPEVGPSGPIDETPQPPQPAEGGGAEDEG